MEKRTTQQLYSLAIYFLSSSILTKLYPVTIFYSKKVMKPIKIISRKYDLFIVLYLTNRGVDVHILTR